jgi:hypothetical protein
MPSTTDTGGCPVMSHVYDAAAAVWSIYRLEYQVWQLWASCGVLISRSVANRLSPPLNVTPAS